MIIPGSDQYELELNYAFPDSTLEELLQVTPDHVQSPDRVSFCRNIFLPLTTACRYTCTYCTYFDVPGKESLMNEKEIRHALEQGVATNCREALFTFGDKPDARYHRVHQRLAEWGYHSLLDYLYQACEWALEYGLLPHSNPGDLTYDELKRLREVNASMGVMLETTADVDAHSGQRRKCPAQRLQTLESAGKLQIPFTTGLLIGIGEDWRDRAHSLLCIKKLHEEWGHIQEVIIQNVVPNDRSSFEKPSVETMRKCVAMARAVLPVSVEVQIPPNLSDTAALLDCGVGDLGGVSPVTDDYINPDYAWPQVRTLKDLTEKAGVQLVERGPIYPQYFNRPGWVGPRIRACVEEHWQGSVEPLPVTA